MISYAEKIIYELIGFTWISDWLKLKMLKSNFKTSGETHTFYCSIYEYKLTQKVDLISLNQFISIFILRSPCIDIFPYLTKRSDFAFLAGLGFPGKAPVASVQLLINPRSAPGTQSLGLSEWRCQGWLYRLCPAPGSLQGALWEPNSSLCSAKLRPQQGCVSACRMALCWLFCPEEVPFSDWSSQKAIFLLINSFS